MDIYIMPFRSCDDRPYCAILWSLKYKLKVNAKQEVCVVLIKGSIHHGVG